MKLECKNNNAFLLVTFSVFYKNNCGLRVSLQNKRLGEFWHYYPLGTSSSLLFTSFLSFPDKRMATPPCLNFKHFFFLLATTLIPVFVKPGFLLTPATLTMRVADHGCRGNMTKLLGFTDDKMVTGILLGSTVTSGWSPCLALTFLVTPPTHTHTHSLLCQINLPEELCRSDSFPCRHFQWFLLPPVTKPCQGLLGWGR